ncbi:conserved hypothetical protein [Hyella patelloides LEGE 07179]|uniref:DUF3082 domain-containing protein n=1 Tax=Hyella patelloides LEGE 07179 TaxID=945734 RepID=A0A563W4B5_9CYAN|nr:DUF3082 domain-containing protein [Hyella patelloides]VEP18373.1 conserved hypothetical protein [Hyella patelloides LEGE 07179]
MSDSQDKSTSSKAAKKEVTPLSCFFASVVSGGIAVMVYFLMSAIVETYADKPIVSPNVIVIKITTAVRTLVIGMAALGTGVFGLVAIGLFLLGIQVTIKSLTNKASSEG